jgi:hypothetical protein
MLIFAKFSGTALRLDYHKLTGIHNKRQVNNFRAALSQMLNGHRRIQSASTEIAAKQQWNEVFQLFDRPPEVPQCFVRKIADLRSGKLKIYYRSMDSFRVPGVCRNFHNKIVHARKRL